MPTPPTKPPTFPTAGAPNAGRDRPASRPPSAPKPTEPADKTKDFFRSAPKLEIPKGGGAIQGIGEKFQANPVSGTASLSVPIFVSPGRQGFQPALSLSYDSGAGNGPFGLGWSLGVPRVQRKTDRGLPSYRDHLDTFVLSDSEDLLPFQAWDGVSSAWIEPVLPDATDGSSVWERRRYRPRVDAAGARIERWTDTTTKEVHWRTWTRENVCRIYGLSSTARLSDPDDPTKIFAWYLQEEHDEHGNRIRYDYVAEELAEDRIDAPSNSAEKLRSRSGQTCTFTYLKRVFYGNTTPFVDDNNWLFELVFDYGEHPGGPTTSPPVPPSHTGGAREDVDGDDGVWDTRLDIFSSFRSRFDVRCYRLCKRVLLYHRFDDPSGVDEPTLVRSTDFSYADSETATTLTSVVLRGWRSDGGTWTTEAMPALSFTYGEAVLDESVQFVEGLEDLPLGLDSSRWRWVDLD
ncbi:MAG TPA: SpvB/TcaC N-terminal domain-containing protein, partial [Myxococcota bacterium]|nr:SpvB/TcaC N-terminal domain-containing protein [Myxococcota bacterium]